MLILYKWFSGQSKTCKDRFVALILATWACHNGVAAATVYFSQHTNMTNFDATHSIGQLDR